MARLCSHPGCYQRVPYGRCPAHQRQPRDRTRYDRDRGSAARRGYDYRWQVYRRRRLAEQPYCEDCHERGHVTASREVHHIAKVRDRPDLRFVDANTRCLCSPCHARRTLAGE